MNFKNSWEKVPSVNDCLMKTRYDKRRKELENETKKI